MKKVNKNFFKKYTKYTRALKVELNQLYQQPEYKKGGKFYKIAQITIGGGGKLLRSLLTLLSCEAICGDYRPALPVAIAYELAHNASLVQDDIIDNSPLRRGKPTVNFQYGTTAAILISDLFIFQIFNMIANYRKYELSKERICQILEIIGNCSKETAVGEYLDEELTGKPNLSERDYFLLISLKTGKLFAAPSACGAIVANGTKNEIDTMYKMGEKIGIAFQIYDDLLDVVAKKQHLGKPVFSDIKNGKQNLVILHAFKNVPLKSRKFIKEILGRKYLTHREEKKLKKILNNTGSITYTQKKCKSFIREAKEYLNKIKNTHYIAKKKILELAQFVITRNI